MKKYLTRLQSDFVKEHLTIIQVVKNMLRFKTTSKENPYYFQGTYQSNSEFVPTGLVMKSDRLVA